MCKMSIMLRIDWKWNIFHIWNPFPFVKFIFLSIKYKKRCRVYSVNIKSFIFGSYFVLLSEEEISVNPNMKVLFTEGNRIVIIMNIIHLLKLINLLQYFLAHWWHYCCVPDTQCSILCYTVQRIYYVLVQVVASCRCVRYQLLYLHTSIKCSRFTSKLFMKKRTKEGMRYDWHMHMCQS